MPKWKYYDYIIIKRSNSSLKIADHVSKPRLKCSVLSVPAPLAALSESRDGDCSEETLQSTHKLKDTFRKNHDCTYLVALYD